MDSFGFRQKGYRELLSRLHRVYCLHLAPSTRYAHCNRQPTTISIPGRKWQASDRQLSLVFNIEEIQKGLCDLTGDRNTKQTIADQDCLGRKLELNQAKLPKTSRTSTGAGKGAPTFKKTLGKAPQEAHIFGVKHAGH